MTHPDKRLLIYRLGSLGDAVVALPAFHLIRRAFPGAKITLLTNRPVASKAAPLEAVLGSGGFFDEVLDYPIGTRNPLDLARLAWQIRKRGIRTMVYLVAARGRKSVARDRAFFRLAGLREIIGLPDEARDFEVCIDPETGLYEQETKRLIRRLRVLGTPDLSAQSSWDLQLTLAEEAEPREFIGDFQGSRFLAVSLGTKQPANDWEESNWRELLKRLTGRLPGWGLLLLGAENEREKSARCSRGWNGRVVNLCGRLSPRASAAALKGVPIFVGHDSGPMHLAAVTGIPCVGIFSARNPPGHWFPYGSQHRVLYHQTDCFGCMLTVCEVEKKKCILSIGIEEVENAVISLLAEKEVFR